MGQPICRVCTCPKPSISRHNRQCYSECIAFHSPERHCSFYKGFLQMHEEVGRNQHRQVTQNTLSNRTDTVVGKRCCSHKGVWVFWKAWQCHVCRSTLTLTAVQLDRTMKPTARAKAKGYIEGLLKFETILTAQIFLRIFEHT